MYYFINEASLYSYFISLNKNIFLINSEGFLYRTSFYFNQNKSNLKLKHYLRNVPKVDMVILVKNKKKIIFLELILELMNINTILMI